MIIGDSSALIALSIIDRLEILEKLYEKLYVPNAVYNEVSKVKEPHGEKLKNFLKDKVKAVDLQIVKVGLGRGELEAIALYKELDADLLLIDDNRAKKYASVNGVRVIGTLGLLIKAKEKGLIDKIEPYLNKLIESDVYISKKLIYKVLELANEL